MSHGGEGTQQPAVDSCLRNYHLIRLLWLFTSKPTTPLPSPRQAVLTCALLPLLMSFPVCQAFSITFQCCIPWWAAVVSLASLIQKELLQHGVWGDFFFPSCLGTCPKFSFHLSLGTSLFNSLHPRWSCVASSEFEALKRFPWAETLPTALQEFAVSTANLVLPWPPKPWGEQS